MNEQEIIKAVKNYADTSAAYLSTNTEYARGYKDGISKAKEIIRNIIKDYQP